MCVTQLTSDPGQAGHAVGVPGDETIESNSSRCSCEHGCDSNCVKRAMPDDETIESDSDDECAQCKGMNGFHDCQCHCLEITWGAVAARNRNNPRQASSMCGNGLRTIVTGSVPSFRTHFISLKGTEKMNVNEIE